MLMISCLFEIVKSQSIVHVLWTLSSVFFINLCTLYFGPCSIGLKIEKDLNVITLHWRLSFFQAFGQLSLHLIFLERIQPVFGIFGGRLPLKVGFHWRLSSFKVPFYFIFVNLA